MALEPARKTTLVITMAGRGSRFQQAGFTQPKYEIVVHGRSLFYWSLHSLHNFIDAHTQVIFVCLAEHHAGPYIAAQCAQLGITHYQVLEIDQVTDGQATTAYLTRELWDDPEAALLVYNIDTFVEPQALHPQQIRAGADGWIPCFQVPGSHWSFVQLGADGWACAVAEKQRISDYASIGLYWFARASSFVDAYQRHFADPANLVAGERYIAPLYRQLIENGAKIAIADLAPSMVHALGTPAEVAAFAQHPGGEL